MSRCEAVALLAVSFKRLLVAQPTVAPRGCWLICSSFQAASGR